jgi:tyrosine-protein phosphatase YwqE
MIIKQIKEKMLNWKNYYGQDIVEIDLIKKAKTKKELLNILKKHYRFLEMQNLDALAHCDDFIKKLGL